MAGHAELVHADARGGLRRPARDSVPLADFTRSFFLPNPPRAGETCRWALVFTFLSEYKRRFL